MCYCLFIFIMSLVLIYALPFRIQMRLLNHALALNFSHLKYNSGKLSIFTVLKQYYGI
jgi:hypothetical protein